MFNNTYVNKKVLVTGHTGFKGSWLCMWLKLMGADVYGISNEIYPSPTMFEIAGVGDEMTSYLADIRNFEETKMLIHQIRPDYIFHMAAQAIVKTAYENPLASYETNIMGTANILEALRLADFPCIAVMITSDKCYDNVEWVFGYKETDALGGKDPYSASKGGAELVIKSYFHSYFKKEERIKLAAVRAGNVIGGGDWAESRIVPDCFRAWAKGQKVIIRSPNATRPWQHVLEPLSGYLRTGELLTTNPRINGEPYNFGPPTNQNHSVLDLIQVLAKNWSEDKEADMVHVEEGNFPESGLLKLNIDKALFDLQWNPTLDFEQTAAFTSAWYKYHYREEVSDMKEFTNIQLNEYIDAAKRKQIPWALK